ncbi:MAG: NINE protein [Lentisphaeria bacterium]|nr:NINE protein [Lentisphaeria bacterium]
MKFQCPHCKASYNLKTAGSYECISCHKSFYFQPKKDEVKITQKPQQTGPQTCPFCLSEVPSGAKKCAHCGEWISGNPPKSNMIYLLLSFLFGHFGIAEFYANRWKFGVTYLFFSAMSIYAKSIPALALIWMIQFVLSSILGVNQTKKKIEPEKHQWVPLVFLSIGVLFLICVFLKIFLD